MKKIIIAFIVLGAVLGILGFWFWQRNSYSKDKLKLEIIGPSETDLLSEIEYTVKYKNNGDVRLEEAKLVFEFPEYTLLEQGQAIRQEIGSEKLGDIYPGEEKVFKFKGRLLGKEGDVKVAKAVLSYHPKNLNANYESKTSLATLIKSAPITLDFDMPSKVQSGQEFDFSLNYFSRLDFPLNNMEIKIEYPDGFEFISSKPKTMGNSEWNIPLLNKTEGGRIEVRGRLTGAMKDQRNFRAVFGMWQGDNFSPLKEITVGVEISKANLYVFQQINGQENYTANSGETLHYEISFRNVEQGPFTDLFLVAKMEGNMFDFDSIRTEQGKFSKGDNSIMFDWRDVPRLRFLGQGEEGKVEFWINLKDNFLISSPQEKNFLIKNTVLVSSAREEFKTKVKSKLVVLQKGFYDDDYFGNSGPNPPKSGQTTTYTIIWQAKNYYNDAKNIKVRAILPSNVSLTGKISPELESSKFLFDSQSREVVWNVSDMEAGKGVLDVPPAIAFQVSLNGSSSQEQIIGEAKITGQDQWVEQNITGISPAVYTNSISN